MLAARAGDPSEAAHQALAVLCETYWYPLYAFLRSRGFTVENAQDLTQAFFARTLEKDAIKRVDPARGRFRSFLLASLKNFAANEYDKEMAMKRGRGVTIIPLEIETAEDRFQIEPPSNETPEKVFDKRWALTLLERVMSRLHAEMASSRKEAQFERLKMYLTGDEAASPYAEIAGDLGMSEGAVKVAVHRLRRRFRDLLRDEIAHTVSSPEEIEDELRHLWKAVGR